MPTLHYCCYSSASTTAPTAATASCSKQQQGGLFSIPELQRPRDFLQLATQAQHECNSLRRDIQNAVVQQQQQQQHHQVLDNVHTARQLLFQLDAISRAVCNVIDAAELARHVHTSESWRQTAEQAFEVLSDYMAQLNSDPYLYQAVTLVTDTKKNNSSNNKNSIWHLLREEEQRFAVLLQAEFERDGIHLPDHDREKVRQIQGHLTELETMFSRNVITCQSDFVVENVSAVYDVLPKHVLVSLGIVEEQQPDDTSKSMLRLPDNSPTPILQTLLKYSADPALREHIFMQAMTAVPENLPVLDALRQTRHELATTLGFDSYAQRFLRDQMAQTPAAVQDFLQQLQTKLQPVYQQQLGQLHQAKRFMESSTDPIKAWDVSFYTSLLQTTGGEGKDVSSSVAPYFTLNHCLASMPVLVEKLFGIEMRKEEHLTANEKWDVKDSSNDETSQIRKYTFSGPDGRPLGTLYLDLHSRPGKYNHAAHFTVRCGCRTTPLLETSSQDEDDYGENYQLPIVTLVCNLSSGPTLSHGEVETLYHEFGHALHSLLSRTEFQHMSGTRAAMDFVETPSHLIENFVWDADFLKLLGVHHVTGEVMPDQLIEALRQSRNSFAAIERQNQILYAKLDQTLFGVPDPQHRTTTQIFADLHHQAGVPYAEGTHWHSRFGHLVTYGAGYYG